MRWPGVGHALTEIGVSGSGRLVTAVARGASANGRCHEGLTGQGAIALASNYFLRRGKKQHAAPPRANNVHVPGSGTVLIDRYGRSDGSAEADDA